MTYQLYKENIMEYKTQAWFCRAVKQSVKLLTYFFNDEHLKEFNKEDLLVTPDVCRSMVEDKTSPAGVLRRTNTGLWTTAHKLTYIVPGGGLDCCRWKEYSVTNYFVIPAKVYKKHNHEEFRSTAADVSSCTSYEAGECQLGKQALIWRPVYATNCRYIPSFLLEGMEHGGMWISNDSQLALTHTKKRTADDCGIRLNISDQGIPYTLVDDNSHNASGKTRLPVHPDISKGKRDLDPKPEGLTIGRTGVVDANLMAAWTQALAYRTRIMVSRAFRQSWLNTCREMKTTVALLKSYILSSPVGAVRTLLKDPLLHAKAGNGFVEVWKCMPIQASTLTFHKQTEQCTKEIPVQFTMTATGERLFGFLDPVTLVIGHRSHLEDCGSQPSVPLQLGGTLGMYQRAAGVVVPVGDVSSLKTLSFEHHEVPDYAELLKPKIYTPMAFYSWEELAPTEDTNSLLATAAAQTEVVELLTAPVYYHSTRNHTAYLSADSLASNLVARGLKNLRTWFSNPYQAWILLTCLVINFWIVIRICRVCSCRLKARRMAGVIRRQVRRLRNRKQPNPDRAAKLRHLELAL